MKPAFLFILIAMVAAPFGSAQEEEDFRVRTTSELVLLDAAVENSHGQRVAGLPKQNFKVYEDQKLQTIGYFNHEDLPTTIGLVVDQSGSMRSKRTDVLKAAIAFVQASNPDDQMFIVNFNDRARLGLPPDRPFSSEIPRLENAISSEPAQGRTALNDAVILALNHAAKGSTQRKALLVLSDGGDNASQHSEKEMMETAERVPATIYTIGLFSNDDPDRNPGLLRRLSRITGGETYLPMSEGELPELLDHIAKEIRSRYTLAYVPARKGASGGVRSIKVEAVDMRGSKLSVHTRTRYRLPDLQ